jgi:hypothetical protein
MSRNILVALILAGSTLPAQADNAFWDGRWSGRISTGANVSIRIAGGKVSDYRFNGRPAKIAYGSISADRVSFSPGSAAVITLTPASQGQASYTFSHPQMGTATGLLTKGEVQARAAARAPKAWMGTWGRRDGWMLTVSQGSMAYQYRGESLPNSNISADTSRLSFDVAPAGRMVMTMRPDEKADYEFAAGGRTTRGLVWRR